MAPLKKWRMLKTTFEAMYLVLSYFLKWACPGLFFVYFRYLLKAKVGFKLGSVLI